MATALYIYVDYMTIENGPLIFYAAVEGKQVVH